MPVGPLLMLAALTRDVDEAGSPDVLSVTFNVDGVDVTVAEFRGADHPRAQGYLQSVSAVTSYHSLSLTNSSVRIGNRGDNAWAPKHILLFEDFWSRTAFPIAMETDLTQWLSSDLNEGALTLPLRLVGLGGDAILIHRLLLLVRTADEDDAGTDSPVQLQIFDKNGQLRMSELITDTKADTPQDDLERGVSNWYFLPVQGTPFSKYDLFIGGRIELENLGKDAWLPDSLYLFGLDTPVGRPTKLVPLVVKQNWDDGVLSQEEGEGKPKVVFNF
jgi:hypothetical protein